MLSIRFFSFTIFVFVFQSRFKNSYWNDLKQLDNTDLNELAKTLPTIAKSSKSANSIKKYSFVFNNLNHGVQITICVLCLLQLQLLLFTFHI